MSYLTYLAVTFGLVFIAVIAMTAGLWFGRDPIKGSCGGIGAGTAGNCAICGGDKAECDTDEQQSVTTKPNAHELV